MDSWISWGTSHAEASWLTPVALKKKIPRIADPYISRHEKDVVLLRNLLLLTFIYLQHLLFLKLILGFEHVLSTELF